MNRREFLKTALMAIAGGLAVAVGVKGKPKELKVKQSPPLSRFDNFGLGLEEGQSCVASFYPQTDYIFEIGGKVRVNSSIYDIDELADIIDVQLNECGQLVTVKF